MRWCIGTAAPSVDATGRVVRISGVTVDITERKEAEERQALLAREVDHRAKNALALVQSIVRLTRADTIKAYIAAVEGRIRALSRAHTMLSQIALAGRRPRRPGRRGARALPHRRRRQDHGGRAGRVAAAGGRRRRWRWRCTNSSTNAAKYGALSVDVGPRAS